MIALDVKQSIAGKRWHLRKYDEMQALAISQAHGVSDTIARMLVARGLNFENAGSFLNPTLRSLLPDPSHLKDMDKAVTRVISAIENGEKIAIFGDYDVDGATSSALLYRYFAGLGINSQVYIPDRIDEGYGPNKRAFAELKASGCSLVITVDCGTTSFEALDDAHQLGLDVIVIDHHVGEPKLPKAVAIINPNRIDEDSSLKNLAAVGMSFIFAIALNRALRHKDFFKKQAEPNLINLLDLVALGTVCDVMPLTELNRAFVTQGLKVMSARNNLGLKTLADVSGVKEKLSAYHLGFVLGPRINAGGRVGEASSGSRLLCTEDVSQALTLAQHLDQYNCERKVIEDQVLSEAILQAESQETPVLMISGKNWHPGVIGIVAGRIKERFNRPTCVIAFDENGIGKSSARSIIGVDLGSMIHAAKQKGLLLAGGGHTMAAGFTVEQEKLGELQEFFVSRLNEMQVDLQPTLTIDSVLTIRGANLEFVESLSALEPYGAGNPGPRFAISDVRIVRADIVGDSHVRCVLKQMDNSTLKGISFRCLDTPLGDILLNSKGRPLHVAGTLSTNSWQGNESVQMIIDDAALASAQAVSGL